jgi:hypothetical protein
MMFNLIVRSKTNLLLGRRHMRSYWSFIARGFSLLLVAIFKSCLEKAKEWRRRSLGSAQELGVVLACQEVRVNVLS